MNRLIYPVAAAFVFVLADCREAPRPQHPTTAPMQQGHAEVPAPPATQPTSAPAAPAEPYHVHLKVRRASDPQTGWLRIQGLLPGASSATADGRWLRQNVIEVNTSDAERIRIDLRPLPLKAGRRIVLRLDRQGFDLASDIGPIVYFERGRAGAWTRVRDEK